MMISRPTKMNDPMTATYSVLAHDVRGSNGTPRLWRRSLHGEAPEEWDRHCRRRELRITAMMRKTGGIISSGGCSCF